MKLTNESAPLLQLYAQRKLMAKMGVRIDMDEVPSWEWDAYHIIEDVLAELQKPKKEPKNGIRR